MSVAQMAVGMATLATFIGETVGFMYEGEQREVNVEQIKDCKNGSLLLLGRDLNRENKYRSFNVQKIQQIAVLVK